MNPRVIDDMGYSIAQVYGAVTDRILINLARYFPYIDDASGIVTGSFDYQSRMLGQIGQINRETLSIIKASMKDADKALSNCLENAIYESLREEEPVLRRAAYEGMFFGVNAPELAPNQMQAFRTYYRQAADKLNLVNTVMLDSTKQAYQSAVSDIAQKIERTQGFLNIGAGETITGVLPWNQAMRHTVDNMVKNGLTGYVDHAGRRWKPETYVAMDIRSTFYNTAREAVWERAEQYGSDLYQVSSHNGARPLCYPWQGKVISRTDSVREVEDLDGNKIHVYAQSETSYGEPAGLFGINCGHYPMTFIPGLSTLRGEPQDPESNARQYANEQEQRSLERKLRAEKLDLDIKKAQGCPDDVIKAQRQRVRDADDRIDEFCDKTGLPRRQNREWKPANADWTGADPDNIEPRDPNEKPPKPQTHIHADNNAGQSAM